MGTLTVIAGSGTVAACAVSPCAVSPSALSPCTVSARAVTARAAAVGPLMAPAAAWAASARFGWGQLPSAPNRVGNRKLAEKRQAMLHTDIQGWPLGPQDRTSG
jgi:hypothetical protein